MLMPSLSLALIYNTELGATTEPSAKVAASFIYMAVITGASLSLMAVDSLNGIIITCLVKPFTM